eukprot:487995-Rhodomonas_salina.2
MPWWACASVIGLCCGVSERCCCSMRAWDEELTLGLTLGLRCALAQDISRQARCVWARFLRASTGAGSILRRST